MLLCQRPGDIIKCQREVTSFSKRDFTNVSRDQADRRDHHGRVEVYVGSHTSRLGPWNRIMVRSEN